MLHDVKTWTIDDIQKMTEQNAKDMALETLSIKDHTIYLVDFSGYFGYSALVFADGRHIYYANEYELHHKNISWTEDGHTKKPYPRTYLRDLYVKTLSSKLFTESEILDTIRDYDDYDKKHYFLRNYYSMRRPYVSIFFIGPETKRKALQEKTATMLFDPYALAYYDRADRDFVDHHIALVKALDAAKARLSDDVDYWKGAFLHEMFNHEYGINWQGNYDVFSVFGNVQYDENDDPTVYMKQLKMSDAQKSAFWKARTEYARCTADSL